LIECKRRTANRLKSERRRQVCDRQDQPTFDRIIAVDREIQKLNLRKNDRIAAHPTKRRQVFRDTEPEIRMDMEPIKNRQRFTLALAAFLDLTPES
jgi:hypothetical protein